MPIIICNNKSQINKYYDFFHWIKADIYSTFLHHHHTTSQIEENQPFFFKKKRKKKEERKRGCFTGFLNTEK
jgi:hypothetical protein